MPSFNFTDELGFEEGLASPSDFLDIRCIDGQSYQAFGDVKFTDVGVYFKQGSSAPYGTGTYFVPYSYMKCMYQNF